MKNQDGYTFVEVMVALAVFSLGIVFILQSFLISLDQTTHLTNRIYANTMTDNRIQYIQRVLKAYQMLPINLTRVETAQIGSHDVDFQQHMVIKAIPETGEIFDLTFTLSWQEGDRETRVTRSAYLADFVEEASDATPP